MRPSHCPAAFNSLNDSVESAEAALNQQLMASSAVLGGDIPGSSGIMVPDHVLRQNGEYFGTTNVPPSLVTNKRHVLGSGIVLCNPGTFHEYSGGHLAMANN